MKKNIGNILLVSSLLLTALVYAKSSIYKNWETQQVTVEAQVNVWFRSAEPSGLFCSRGKQLGVIEKGQNVKVRKYIVAKCGIFFTYDYLEVDIVDPKPNQSPWGIVSAVNDDGSPLFKAIEEGDIL